jgi:hypothetical protein
MPVYVMGVIYFGLISADQLLKIAQDAGVLIAWVLVVAVLWAIGERLFANFRKRP